MNFDRLANVFLILPDRYRISTDAAVGAALNLHSSQLDTLTVKLAL